MLWLTQAKTVSLKLWTMMTRAEKSPIAVISAPAEMATLAPALFR